MSTVADKLHDAGLIKYKWFFKLYAGISHADKKIGIGTYELNTEMDYRALILGMHNSSGNLTAETVTVTIPEGYTVRQTIRLLAEKGVNTKKICWKPPRPPIMTTALLTTPPRTSPGWRATCSRTPMSSTRITMPRTLWVS